MSTKVSSAAGVGGRSLTHEAVEKQLDAMPCSVYEVGIFDMAKDVMHTRVYDRATLLRSVGYLRQRNATGANLYIRPAGEHAFSLIDDLNAASVAALAEKGFRPCVVIETSPGNFQAWVNHGQKLPAALGTEAAKTLAENFGGDPGAAAWRQYGRLAGFTNRKPKYELDGKFPFCRLKTAENVVYEGAPEFVAAASQRLREREAAESERRRAMLAAPSRSAAGRSGDLKSIRDFWESPAYSGDFHRADLAYAAYALSRAVRPADVAQAIASRDLSHKGSAKRVEDYIERTIAKAQERASPGARGLER